MDQHGISKTTLAQYLEILTPSLRPSVKDTNPEVPMEQPWVRTEHKEQGLGVQPSISLRPIAQKVGQGRLLP
jgi:hypothetical protein